MKVRFSKKAKKYFDKMPNDYQSKVKLAIQGLKEQPPKGDIKKLEGTDDGSMRLRVGMYRVIFRYITEGIIEILFIQDIGPRGDIYK